MPHYGFLNVAEPLLSPEYEFLAVHYEAKLAPSFGSADSSGSARILQPSQAYLPRLHQSYFDFDFASFIELDHTVRGQATASNQAQGAHSDSMTDESSVLRDPEGFRFLDDLEEAAKQREREKLELRKRKFKTSYGQFRFAERRRTDPPPPAPDATAAPVTPPGEALPGATAAQRYKGAPTLAFPEQSWTYKDPKNPPVSKR